MINQYEVPALIEDAIPELRKPLHRFPAVFHVYETMTCLSNYTRKQLEEQNYSVAGECLEVAGRLYDRGNEVVKGAIEQHFLPALSCLPVPDGAYRIKFYSLIPASLYTLFIQHQIGDVPQINKQ
ncbi:hypothetical protein [uncultured Chitinophaga sp.]|jgi:hypothetical protein|uniref:DUF7674 family protein n=1 Tax=uncultured Chitinophaga sp. TaxID=339340 RepID=UPI002603345E|nr:hypothetical protein [uncultured Chitinophaga sp.]